MIQRYAALSYNTMGVAVVVGLAVAAEACPERVTRGGAVGLDSRGLVVDGEEEVHPLNVLGRSNGAIGVRRSVEEAGVGETADAGEVEHR